MIRVLENILPDATSVREAALRAEYIDWTGYDGEVYKRIRITEIPGLRDAIEAEMGPVDMLGMGYRLNFGGEMPNHAIHSDMGWGTHAAVVYLSEGEGGTAFWRHKETCRRSFRPGDDPGAYADDWDDETKWDRRLLVPMKLNRGLIYESALFHSRYPFTALGTGPDDGRLIAVAFFTPR